MIKVIGFILIPFAFLSFGGLIAVAMIVQAETAADAEDCAAIRGSRFDWMDRDCWSADGRKIFIDGNNLL